jgi:hypothetical protein
VSNREPEAVETLRSTYLLNSAREGLHLVGDQCRGPAPSIDATRCSGLLGVQAACLLPALRHRVAQHAPSLDRQDAPATPAYSPSTRHSRSSTLASTAARCPRVADELGLAYEAAKKRRRRAEAGWAAWWLQDMGRVGGPGTGKGAA